MEPYFQNVVYPLELPARAYLIGALNAPLHWHIDVEMVCVLGGTLGVQLEKTEYRLREGDLFLCGSRQIHGYTSETSENQILIAMFNPELVGFPDGWPAGAPGTSAVVIDETQHSPEERQAISAIRQALMTLTEETRAFGGASPYFMRAALYELCGNCLRGRLLPLPEHKTEPSRRTGDVKTIFAILNYMDTHYAQSLTLTGISADFYLSPSYLCRLFKKTTGIGFSDYLMGVRVNQVMNLLRSSDASISDIAYRCGFENLRSFNRSFRKINGMTPSEYRKRFFAKDRQALSSVRKSETAAAVASCGSKPT